MSFLVFITSWWLHRRPTVWWLGWTHIIKYTDCTRYSYGNFRQGNSKNDGRKSFRQLNILITYVGWRVPSCQKKGSFAGKYIDYDIYAWVLGVTWHWKMNIYLYFLTSTYRGCTYPTTQKSNKTTGKTLRLDVTSYFLRSVHMPTWPATMVWYVERWNPTCERNWLCIFFWYSSTIHTWGRNQKWESHDPWVTRWTNRRKRNKSTFFVRTVWFTC